MRRGNQQWWVTFWLSFSWYGWNNNYCRTSRMPPSSIFTNGKETNKHAVITTESPYFQFQARFLLESFWIASTTISNMDSYQRVNVASVRNMRLLTWCLLQEKYQEQNTDLYLTYVDMTKAFDMVSRDGLWRIMAKYGCPQKFITIVRQFHDTMHARVQYNRESSLAFPVTNEVEQRCVLALTHFSIMFSAMLFDAFSGSDNGINIWYLTDTSVFNLRRLKAKTKVKTHIEFLFANDCGLNATTKANM